MIAQFFMLGAVNLALAIWNPSGSHYIAILTASAAGCSAFAILATTTISRQ